MSVAVIGTGWGARVQVPAFKSTGLPVVALAGRDLAKTERIARDLDVPTAYDDWRQVLARDDVRLVSIVTPPYLHREMALTALAAGKHVLCEKPTALNASEASEMVLAAAIRPDQLALIDHELRFLPSTQLARDMIHDGVIGRVRHFDGQILSSSRADPRRVWNWWSDASLGGGVLGAIGSHHIDMMRFLLGVEVVSVSAILHTTITERMSAEGVKPVTADDFFNMTLRLTNSAVATLRGTVTISVGEPETITVYGTKGTLRWVDGRLWHAQPGQSLQDITPLHRYPLPDKLNGAFPHGTVYLGHALRSFLEGDSAALAPAATFHDGLRIQEVLDAARRSNALEGRTME